MSLNTERTDLVFLGPSLTRSEARDIYPNAIYLPPASMGDLISAVRQHRPHAIALIDGSFFNSMATYHKEIIDAMTQGIWVIGASSMGALRAAECAEFGMIGVGEIFEAYASGEIEDDDEVALSHVTEDFGFRPVTDAMVDIRASLGAALAAGVLTIDEETMLVNIQKSRWFMERHLLDSIEDARQSMVMDPERIKTLDSFLRTNRVSVKARDARSAIAALRDLPDGPMSVETRPELPYSRVYEATTSRDVLVEAETGDRISLDKIRRFFTLTDERTADIWKSVRDRSATHRLMSGFGVELTQGDFGRAREAIAADLDVAPGALIEKCLSMDMTEGQVQAWIREEAYVLRARGWMGGHSIYTLLTTEFLNQLRRMGEYEHNRRGAAFQEKMMEASPHRHTQLGLAGAMNAYQQLAHWTPPEDLDAYLSENNLGSRAEFYERLMAGVAAGMELFGLPMIEINDEGSIDHTIAPKNSRGG